MTYLVDLVGRPKGHGVRPHSLKVPTIPLMTAVIKGQGNSPQLSIQWNYRAVTAHDVGNIYSRNVAHQRIFVSDLAQNTPHVKKSQGDIKSAPPVFSADTHRIDIEVHESEFERC